MLEQIKIKIQEVLIFAIQTARTLPIMLRGVILISMLAIFPGYFIIRTASQSFWNVQYRSGVLAARTSFQNPKAPRLNAVTILPVGSTAYSAFTQVTNENFELSADNVPYTFIFKNLAGETVYSSSGKLFLLPGQSTYIVAPKFTAPEPVASGVVNIDSIQWQKPFSLPQVSLTTIRPDTALPIDTDPYTLEIAVRNDSPYQLKQVKLSIIIYGKANAPILATIRNEFTVNPNETRKFPLALAGLDSASISRVQVIPETDILDASNLLLMQSGANGSDLQHPSTNF